MEPQPALDSSEDERLPLGLLVSQLAQDAQNFARAEAELVRARLGEGWRYAVPAFAMIGIAIAIAFGALIALPVGLMFILAPYMGLPLSVALVMVLAALTGAVLLKLGVRRIKAALKVPEDR